MLSGILRIDSNGRTDLLPVVHGADDVPESWIQQLIFEHPELVPAEVLGGAEPFIPICRELTLSAAAGSVFLDIFGVTPTGRPVLIECKLWRNPQARREVVGQILEYSALLQGLGYEDVVARCRSRLGGGSSDPVLDAARSVVPGLNESSFVDQFASCLGAGDFVLVIAGDGIRSEVRRIVDQLTRSGSTFRRFSLLELKVARHEDGSKVVVPLVPFEVERPRLPVTGAQVAPPVDSDDEEPERETRHRNPEAMAADRAFWDRFIADVHFDYADQPRPRHGGQNYVRMALPSPLRNFGAYRIKTGRMGVWISFGGDAALAFFDSLREDAEALREEIADDLILKTDEAKGKASMFVEVDIDVGDPNTEDEQLRWLKDTSNRFLVALRQRLSRWG